MIGGLNTRIRIGGLVAGGLIALSGAVPPALATHTYPRDVTLKYSSSKHKFKGKLKSPESACLTGIVTVHRVETGPNPIVTSDAAGANGKWSAGASRRNGRYYATAESFQTPSGTCPDVRSRTLQL